jgi:hypothetical protein
VRQHHPGRQPSSWATLKTVSGAGPNGCHAHAVPSLDFQKRIESTLFTVTTHQPAAPFSAFSTQPRPPFHPHVHPPEHTHFCSHSHTLANDWCVCNVNCMHADAQSRLKNAFVHGVACTCTNLTRTCARPPRQLAGVWVKWWDNNIPGNCLMGCPEPTELMDGLASYTSLVSVKFSPTNSSSACRVRCTDPHTPSHRTVYTEARSHGMDLRAR